MSEYLDDNFGLKVNGFDLWTQSYARGSTVGIALAYGHAELNYRSEASIADGATVTDGTCGHLCTIG